MLRRENYEVRTAENGSAGLLALDAFQPDLVVLDLMLPDCSGYDLCKEITKRQAVPVIMLSAKNEIIDKVLGLELGGRGLHDQAVR
ncbi:response regulator [Paenibacillus rhizoplanae]